MAFSGNFCFCRYLKIGIFSGLDDSFQPSSSESVNPKNLQEGMTQSRDSILDDSRNRRKILSQTQLYSITSFYQISKALIQRSKNPPPPFFPNHAKFFSLISQNQN